MFLIEVGPTGQTLVQLHAVLGAQALFWCTMSLLILCLSMWKLEKDSLAGYSLVYWSCILIAIILELSAWAYFMRDYGRIPDGAEFTSEWMIASNMPIHQYLMAISLSLYEFAFSIVNLSLTALGSVFRMKTRTREFVWLGFNFLQIPVTVIITFLQTEYGHDKQSQYWSMLFNSCMQLINISVFSYWYIHVLREASGMTFSPQTARLYARILTRFVEYMFVYCLYIVLFLLNSMATIVDIANSANGSWMIVVMAIQPSYFVVRYFLVFMAVYIFQPAWLRAIEQYIVSCLRLMPGASHGGERLKKAQEGMCILSQTNSS